MIVIDLLYNLSILVTLTFFAGLTEEFFRKNSILNSVVQGMLFGGVAIIAMLNPFVLTTGIIFDGRTIVINICTLFYGPLSGVIAVVISAVYRIHIGGSGVYTGVASIVAAMITGYAAYYLRKKKNIRLNLLNLYLFGLISNIVTMIVFLTLPAAFLIEAYKYISLTVIGIYPVIFVISGKILSVEEEKKINAGKIKSSEEKYRAIHNNAPIPFLTLDSGGKILDANPAFLSSLNYTPEEVIGSYFKNFMSSESKIHFDEKFSDLQEIESINNIELVLNKKSGEIIIVIFEGKKGSIKEGNRKNIYCVFKDITKQKIAESELIRAKEKAEEGDKLKTAFLQNMSHEIRTPLNGILGFASLLREKEHDRKDVNLFSEMILNSGNRLLNLINNIIELSRIESGNLKVKYSEFFLNELLNKIKNQIIPFADEKSLNLSFKYGESDKNSAISSDKSILYQVLTNLLNNAVKFTNSGSVSLTYEFSGDNIIFKIADTGCGIPEGQQEKIFDRFYQVDMSISREYEGAGLGLAICRGMLKALHGKINLTSGINKGSTFTVIVPLKKIKLQIKDTSLSDLTKIKIKKIMIAEDDDLSYDYLRILLENSRFEVVRAKDGNEAVEKCRKSGNIDLILMDIRMPGKNGYEATKEIKKIFPEIKIIAQTANFSKEDMDEAYTAGCDGYLSKPISAGDLYSSINGIYDKD